MSPFSEIKHYDAAIAGSPHMARPAATAIMATGINIFLFTYFELIIWDIPYTNHIGYFN